MLAPSPPAAWKRVTKLCVRGCSEARLIRIRLLWRSQPQAKLSTAAALASAGICSGHKRQRAGPDVPCDLVVEYRTELACAGLHATNGSCADRAAGTRLAAFLDGSGPALLPRSCDLLHRWDIRPLEADLHVAHGLTGTPALLAESFKYSFIVAFSAGIFEIALCVGPDRGLLSLTGRHVLNLAYTLRV
jgi:hypothetical protein